jgi:hypothetical protein
MTARSHIVDSRFRGNDGSGNRALGRAGSARKQEDAKPVDLAARIASEQRYWQPVLRAIDVHVD